jgi:hypothetical protein
MAMEWSSIGSSLAVGKATAAETIPDNETAENAEAPKPLSTRGNILMYTIFTASRLSSGRGDIPEPSLGGL